jgi:hypothetical protein
MLDFLLSLLVGWPAILIAVILTILGLVRNRYPFLYAAAIIAFPFSWFLSGLPRVSFPAILVIFVPTLLFGSSYAMSRGREMISWMLAIPFFLVVLLLFFVIVSGAA